MQEKRRIVELTLQPGMSVARVAQAEGVNSHQVFQWRRAYRQGELAYSAEGASALLTVVISSFDSEAAVDKQKATIEKGPISSGAIRVELPGGTTISAESGVDPATHSSGVGEFAQMIELRTGTHIWIAAGVTDMWRGFQGVRAQIQTKLEQQPFSGHVFVFRGRRGDMIKLLWFDGDGLCLFAKRLERGRFIWPQAKDGTVSLTRPQLSVLIHPNDGGPVVGDPGWKASIGAGRRRPGSQRSPYK